MLRDNAINVIYRYGGMVNPKDSAYELCVTTDELIKAATKVDAAYLYYSDDRWFDKEAKADFTKSLKEFAENILRIRFINTDSIRQPILDFCQSYRLMHGKFNWRYMAQENGVFLNEEQLELEKKSKELIDLYIKCESNKNSNILEKNELRILLRKYSKAIGAKRYNESEEHILALLKFANSIKTRGIYNWHTISKLI